MMSNSKKIHFSIIILCYNKLEEATRPCIESILQKKNNYSFELVIVDNNSQDSTATYLSELKKSNPDRWIKVIENKTNKGYAEGNNDGIKVAEGEYIVLLNNDTLVTDCWLDRFYNHFGAHTNCGLVGPITNNAGTEQKIKIDGLDENNYQEKVAPYLEMNKKKFFHTERLSFFCVAFRNNLVAEIGLLDPGYSIGMFEDDDYCMRARLNGKTIDVIEDCFIYHKGSVSFKELDIEKYHDLFERNKTYYCTKFNTSWTFSDVAINYLAKIAIDIKNELDGNNIKENIRFRIDDIFDLLNVIKNKEVATPPKIEASDHQQYSYIDNTATKGIFNKIALSIKQYGVLKTLRKIARKLVRKAISLIARILFRVKANDSPALPFDIATPIKTINVEVVDMPYVSNRTDKKLSIVTTVFNEAKNIESFLDSIRKQDFKADEIIIVDGGSTDGTCDLLQSYSQKYSELNLKIFVEIGCTIAKGRNVGISKASNENIILTDAGTRMAKNFCKSLLIPFELDSNVDLVSGITIPHSKITATWIASDYDNYNFQDFLPSARGVAIKKSIFNKVKGGFPEYLTKTGEDTLFMIFYRSYSNKWLINKAAKITWEVPDTLDEIIKLKQSYAYGDGESGFGDWNYSQFTLVRLSSYLSGKKKRPSVERRRGIANVDIVLANYPFEWNNNKDLELAKELISKNRKVFYIQEPFSYFGHVKKYIDFDFTLIEISHINAFDVEDFCFYYKDFNVTIHDNLKTPTAEDLIEKIRVFHGKVNA